MVLPELISNLIYNPPRLSNIFQTSIGAILNDFNDNPSAKACIKKLTNKQSCDSPEVLQHTLKVLYEAPTIGTTKETITVLLEKDSIRLAIILYARSNGIDIEQEDIDAVQEILNESDPELGNFLRIAKERMIEKYGVDKAQNHFEKMEANNKCS